MKLERIMQSIPYVSSRPMDGVEIEDITCDSRKVMPGMLFVCIKGAAQDGHDHAAQAVERGAAAVLVQHDLGLENQLLVETPGKPTR